MTSQEINTKEINTKVCIIGAGLAGLVVANILRKHGIPCVVIEQSSQTEIYSRSRAELIDYKSLAILKEHGLSDRLLRVGKPQSKCEFRTPEQSFILDYSKMTEGQIHYTYPQHELIADLIYQLQQAGGQILFGTKGINITNERFGAAVACRQENRSILVKANFIAGCDGFDGVSRKSIPENASPAKSAICSYAWLAITAEAPPSSPHIVYSIHDQGFAGHMPRNETISRYYLQIPLQDEVADWSDERIWSELHLRLARDNWSLTEGRIIDKQILTLRSSTSKSMHCGSLFLAGDAAHILTPAGGKGMNLAIQDADVLGKSFVAYYRYQDNSPLKNYSELRLAEIREIQDFSESLWHMLNMQNSPQAEESNFLRLLQKFKLSQLMNSFSFAQDFAKKYVGYVETDEPLIGGGMISQPMLPPAQGYDLKPLVIVK